MLRRVMTGSRRTHLVRLGHPRFFRRGRTSYVHGLVMNSRLTCHAITPSPCSTGPPARKRQSLHLPPLLLGFHSTESPRQSNPLYVARPGIYKYGSVWQDRRIPRQEPYFQQQNQCPNACLPCDGFPVLRAPLTKPASKYF